MDYSQYVTKLIKIDKIRQRLNPIMYYSLKYIYSPEFAKRSPCFTKALKHFFLTYGSNIKLDLLGLTTVLESTNSSLSSQKEIYNAVKSKDNIDKLKGLFSNDMEWFIKALISFDSDYILDSSEDFVLLHMIKSYIFGDNVPETSELMLGYNLFSSSIELIFCLRLALEFPIAFFQQKEKKHYLLYTRSISNRIASFWVKWRSLFPNKYNKSKVIQHLMKNTANCAVRNTEHVDVNTLTLDEPLLTVKYISHIRLLREGLFLYEINEIAKQLCLIDHECFETITQKDILDYIVKKEMPESFNNCFKREKQLQSYILIFLTFFPNLENKRNIIQSFIHLAYTCKKMSNFQACHMIISALIKINISKKTMLWRLVEKKYKDIFNLLEQEYSDLDLNEKTFFELLNKEVFLYIPHVSVLRNQINSYIIQIKNATEEKKAEISKEIQHFFLKINSLQKAKYPFFVVNPLNDFLKFGFLEVNKTKQWGIKSRFDFIEYSNPNADFGKLLDLLMKFYKKSL